MRSERIRGGLALYGPGKRIVGAVGVSGDTSCADHDIAWRVRNNLGLDHLQGVGGVRAMRPAGQHYLRHYGQPKWRNGQ